MSQERLFSFNFAVFLGPQKTTRGQITVRGDTAQQLCENISDIRKAIMSGSLPVSLQPGAPARPAAPDKPAPTRPRPAAESSNEEEYDETVGGVVYGKMNTRNGPVRVIWLYSDNDRLQYPVATAWPKEQATLEGLIPTLPDAGFIHEGKSLTRSQAEEHGLYLESYGLVVRVNKQKRLLGIVSAPSRQAKQSRTTQSDAWDQIPSGEDEDFYDAP